MIRKIILFVSIFLASGFLIYGLLQIDFVARAVTPKKYWRAKIYFYQSRLEKTKKTALIKEIQLKKKIMTGDLDVAQDMILGIDRDISISVVQSEVEKLTESLSDSERAVHDLEIRLSEAQERFNQK